MQSPSQPQRKYMPQINSHIHSTSMPKRIMELANKFKNYFLNENESLETKRESQKLRTYNMNAY